MYGVNQETVSAEDIEKYSLNSSTQAKQMREIKQFRGVQEVVVLCTDMRNEYYLHVDETIFKHGDLLRYLSEFTQKPLKEVILETYSKFNEDVIRHLFSVTSGMETKPKGDLKPLTSVEEALLLAEEENSSGFVLKDLFETAIHYAQDNHLRVAMAPLKEAEIPQCLNGLRKDLDHLGGKKFVLFGAGEETLHFTQLLLHAEAESVTIANANVQSSMEVFDQLSAIHMEEKDVLLRRVHAIGMDSVGYRLATADAIIVAPSVEHAWISEDLLNEMKELRQTKKVQWVIDLSQSQEEYLLTHQPMLEYVKLDEQTSNQYSDEEKEVARTYFDESLFYATDQFMEKYKAFIDRKETASMFSKLVPETGY